MSLESWARNSWIQPSAPNRDEIARWFQVVDRDLSDAAVTASSSDGRFLAAYSAAETLCRIALAASGYRVPKGPNQHRHSLESLVFTLGSHHRATCDQLAACRRKRHSLTGRG
jgi:hypothetical protein